MIINYNMFIRFEIYLYLINFSIKVYKDYNYGLSNGNINQQKRLKNYSFYIKDQSISQYEFKFLNQLDFLEKMILVIKQILKQNSMSKNNSQKMEGIDPYFILNKIPRYPISIFNAILIILIQLF
ncbi:unnamed protein product [Paramecium sonneborni]|uniref:Uncharacterized protein n=1 Tax=Paramecium sonneborni TaxID=65129 RepID=A0A8S1LX94_9CILI|nr:unnamed protein product [Paramecium sonneborni]